MDVIHIGHVQGSSPQVRWLCSPPKPDITVLAVYEDIIKETLESLSEHVEYLLESQSQIEEWDVTLSDGVLTVKLNEEHGTYVINKQTPNRQIWLSSPI
ncbi:FXN, partial [Cordylochernes scorpioides]